MGRYLRGSVDENLSLGTLASLTLVSANFDESVVERTLISSLVATYAMTDFTSGVQDGPIIVGVAHSDYTDAEIEEVLENTGSWNEGDIVQTREVGKRLIRRIGVFVPGGNHQPTDTVALNDGKPVKTKLNWILTTGDTLVVWCYNAGGSALAGTSPQVQVTGHANLWPR